MKKRYIGLMVMAASGPALAGFESMLNPFGNPLANPLFIAAPLGAGMLAPGLFGSPLGFGSPLPGMGGLSGMGALYPAMQIAPSIMSFQHQAPQMLTNPYFGNPFSQLPFSQRTPTLPYFGGGLPTQANPYPFLPQLTGINPGWNARVQQPAIPFNPYLMQAPPRQQIVPAAPPSAMLQFNPAAWLQPSQPTSTAPDTNPTPWQQPAESEPEQTASTMPPFNPTSWLAPLLQLPTGQPQ